MITCQECFYYHTVPSSLKEGFCMCNPPTPFPLIQQDKMCNQVATMSLIPTVKMDKPICKEFKRKVVS